jgi:hypothetical protein
VNAIAYYPDGGPVQRGKSFSPITNPEPGHGPDNIQLFQTLEPLPPQSAEQGIGRSPGQRWPHMPHVEQYSFASLTNQSDHPTDLQATRPERQGWSAPVYYEQAVSQHHVFPMPILIDQAPTHVYAQLGGVPA